ncbi:glycosyltransferase family 2 protein [Halomonas qinghailakensis]|uniref:Glycosyltransferase family 2 protein n=1 Tax=Halomonas qinghailakensis TaxID=2937790 RepID=A0AA46TNY7_9GAMM|nr:glycosyltransferase family 2 protein [Halomonas sp. ZZQ-149]UYO73855.1 glycosyltransferase family 2 protein [Halomonas sp. ZZQ-149]
MNNISFFSVVIPNYKRVEELVRAVRSALSQGDLVEEVIIVDDFSDNIQEISDAIAALDSDKVSIIRNDFKSNAAQTRNQGGKAAKAQWVLLLDSDDVFLAGKLNAIKTSIEKVNNPKAVFYNKAQVWFDDKLEKIVPSRPLGKEEDISNYLFNDFEIMQTSTLAIPKFFFDDIGFNESYKRHQDYDLCLSLYEAGFEFNMVDVQGTAIYWGSSTRPTDKGESAEYSSKWIIENKYRITPEAFDNFYFYFVVLKLLRSGEKLKAVKEIKAISDLSNISIKKKLMFLILFIIPSFLMNSVYRVYKKLLTTFASKRAGNS